MAPQYIVADRTDSGAWCIPLLSGQDWFTGAWHPPHRIEFNGWDDEDDPQTYGIPYYRIRAYCQRIWIYQCAHRTASSWYLPTPTGIYARASTTAPHAHWDSDVRPYASLSWGGAGYTNLEGYYEAFGGKNKGASGISPINKIDESTAASFSITGARLYALASAQYQEGLDALIPVNAKHDLLIFGVAYKWVRKKDNAKDVRHYGRKLWVVVSQFAVADHTEP